MNAESIRAFLRSQPFVPFEVRMTNGDTHLISHPENAMLAGSRLVIYHPGTERISTVSLLHIAGVDLLQVN
jgi:hypothetical protein